MCYASRIYRKEYHWRNFVVHVAKLKIYRFFLQIDGKRYQEWSYKNRIDFRIQNLSIVDHDVQKPHFILNFKSIWYSMYQINQSMPNNLFDLDVNLSLILLLCLFHRPLHSLAWVCKQDPQAVSDLPCCGEQRQSVHRSWLRSASVALRLWSIAMPLCLGESSPSSFCKADRILPSPSSHSDSGKSPENYRASHNFMALLSKNSTQFQLHSIPAFPLWFLLSTEGFFFTKLMSKITMQSEIFVKKIS